jgi:hypothetical protein
MKCSDGSWHILLEIGQKVRNLVEGTSVESGNWRFRFRRLQGEHVLTLSSGLLRRLQLLLVLDGDQQRVKPLRKLQRCRLRVCVENDVVLRRFCRRLQQVELRDDGDDGVGDGPAKRAEKFVLVDVETRRVSIPVPLTVCLDDVVEVGPPA